MKIISTFLLAIFFCLNATAKNNPKFISTNISEDLIKNADAVIRSENIECHILSPSKTKIKYKYIITVLNERGLNEAKIRLLYSSFSKISGLTGAVYEADGKRLTKIKYNEIRDFSAISHSSLYTDNRIKVYSAPTKTTPFTIHYEFEIDLDGSLFLPSWSAFKGYNVSVEESNYTVVVAPGVDFKYQEYAINSPAVITNTDKGTVYSWGVKHMKAPTYEPFDISVGKQFPTVTIVINDFEFYKTKGSLKNWQTFGEWISGLNSGLQDIPEETKMKVIEAVAGAKSEREKVDIIYKYMQNKTHYVNIDIGIGGWKPIDAARVDETNYGDCKALSNYTRSLLKVIGIDSYYALIAAGSNVPDFNKEFVSSQFNHAMLCVPLENDTIWLECTNQKIPPGFLTTFTDDRYALLIDGNNSKLVKTPALNGFNNGENRKSSITINADLSAGFTVTSYYGGEYESEVYWWDFDDTEKVKRKTYEKIPFPKFDLHSYSYTPVIEENTIKEQLDFTVSSFVSTMGQMLVLELNSLNKQNYTPKKVFDRRSDVLIQRTCVESDTIEYILPQGFVLDSEIKPTTITSDFGTYESKVEFKNGTLIYIRNLIFNKGTYEKSSYGKLVAFFKDIRSADMQKALLRKSIE